MLPTKHTLQNNIRVLLSPMDGTEAVTVMVLVKAGSRCEDAKTNGLAHFLEHMFFKGGKKYPTAKAVAVAADSIGAKQSAYTSQEEAAYSIQCAGSQLEKALDILSDMIFKTQFREEDIERESGVVLEEINTELDNPSRQIWDDWQQTIYGNQPLGWPVLGPPENIREFNSDCFRIYRTRFYTTDRIVISIAGKIDSSAPKLVKKYFGPQPSSIGSDWARFDCALCTPNAVNIHNKDTAQAHFILGVRAAAYGHEFTPATRLISAAMGEGMSSRLSLALREKQGLCYDLCSLYEACTDAGFLGVYAGVALKKIRRAVASVVKEYGKIYEQGVTKRELKKIKGMLEGQIALGLENSSSMAEFFGKQELLYGSMESPREMLDKLQAVTLEDVHRTARKILDPRMLCLTVIGPYKDSSEFSELLHH